MKRIISYNISESFNLVRWCLVVIAFSFVAVVSVAKYVELSDLTALTYSSLETTYLVLNDTTSIIYIYLPLYLFLICGVMFDDNFGSLEVIKCGSRRNWVLGKFATLLFYTMLYFIVLVGINYLISDQVFPFSRVWSQDFVKVQVMMGQDPRNFVYPPLVTMGLSIISVGCMYLCVGSISVCFSLVTHKEAYALLFSLVCGIVISMLFVFGLELTTQVSVLGFAVRNGVLIGITVLMVIGSIIFANRKDFSIEKKQ